MSKAYQISIYSDGVKNTYATVNGKYKGMAKCSPEDTFDIVEGIKIATERAMRKMFPAYSDVYYYPDFLKPDLYGYSIWTNDDFDKKLDSFGLVFKTEKEAIAKAKEMLGIG